MKEIWEPVITIGAAIVGLAIVAVLVSQRSNTANVLASLGGAFSNALSAAVSPVTGNTAAPNVNAGTSGGFGMTPLAGGNIGAGLSLGNQFFGS